MKAIFLDLDDVLVFSEGPHAQAWQIALNELGIDPSTIDFQSMVGMSDFNQAIQFKQIYSLQPDPLTICDLKRDTFLELTKKGFESAAGRNEFLEQAARQHILAVVSSSPRRVIERVLSIEKILQHFQFIVSFEDCDQHKPHPMPYQKALVGANVLPHEALVIEDSVTGITSAKNAGIPVIGLLKDQRPEQILSDTRYFNNYVEIQAALLGAAK